MIGAGAIPGVISSAGGALLEGPDAWEPWHYWDAVNAVDSTDFDWPSNNGASFVQTVDADEPGVIASDANWNSNAIVQIKDATDAAELDAADVSLTDQRFLHDGTSDWFVAIPFLQNDTAQRYIFDSTAGFTGPGINARPGASAGYVRVSICTTGGTALAVFNISGQTSATPHLLFLKYDSGSDTVYGALDGGAWTSQGLSGTKATGDAATTLTIGNGGAAAAQTEIPFLFISKTIPSAAREEEILSYHLDRFVPAWPSAVVGAYTPEDVTTSGSDVTQLNDQTGNANHITDSGSGNRPSLDSVTYGAAVVDYDGVGEWLVLPSAYCSAITGTEDQPLSLISGIRATATGGALIEAGASGTDYAARYTITGTAVRSFRRRDSGAGDKTGASSGSFANNAWETNGLFCDGASVAFTLNTSDATSTSDVDVGATTSATTGRLGSNNAGSIFYTGQMGRLVLADDNLEGMARAKMLRWVHSYTETL